MTNESETSICMYVWMCVYVRVCLTIAEFVVEMCWLFTLNVDLSAERVDTPLSF